MTKLLTLAKKQKARVLLSGDFAQHGSVERGDSFRLLIDYAGMDMARLSTIVRQKPTLYKNAVSAIHQGKMTLALEWLHTMDAFTEIPDNHKRYQALADDYFQYHNNKQSTLIVSPTHFEADQIVPISGNG